MAYGTAPHRVAPGVWATQNGRRLTPAGSAYWEHHHQQGLVTADGHVTHPALVHPLAPPIAQRVAPPPRGVPNVTAPQWKRMSPKQQMATQVTLTLTAAERARLNQQRAKVAPHAPPVPRHVNVPIGFGGASGITSRFAAIQAAWLKAHPPQPTQLQMALSYAAGVGQVDTSRKDVREAIRVTRAYNAAGTTLMPIAKAMGGMVAHGLEGGLKDFASLGTGLVESAAPGHSGASPEQKRRAFTAIPRATTTIGANTIGPALTNIIQGKHAGGGAIALDAALLPLNFGLVGAAGKVIRGAARGVEVARAAEVAARAAEAASLPERAAQVARWQAQGIPEDHIAGAIKFFDNQAAHYPEGQAAYWRDRVGTPTGETPQEVDRHGGVILYQRTPEAAAAKAKGAILDAQTPTNAAWRDRHGIPHDMTSKGFVETPSGIALPRAAHIPNVVFDAPVQRKRLISKLFPQGSARKATGIPTTPDLWRTTADGQVFKIAGNISVQDWVERVRAVVRDPKLIDELANWYTHYESVFSRAFGADAPEIMRSFAVSQANASPASGLTAVLKVMDRLSQGDPLTRNEYSVVGLNIQKAVQDKEITTHIAAKLSDFVDSLAGNKTRAWMGHDPRGGSPVAVDVHAIRDRGFVDKKLQARLESSGAKLGKDFILEGNGTANGAHYERIAEWYHQITDHLNEIRFNGRSNWTPAQAQALGWSTIQKAHDVIPEGFREAFALNSRSIGFEVTKGATGLGADLTPAQTRRVAKAMLPHARALAEDIPGLYVRDVKVELGGWGTGSNPMITVEVIGSRQAVQDSLTHFAQAFDQGAVQAAREVSGANSRAAVIIHSPQFKSERAKAKFWEALNRLSPVDKRRTIRGPDGVKIPNPSYNEPILQGYMPWDEKGVPAIAIRTGSPSVSPKTQQAFIDKFKDAIVKAGEEAGIPEPGYTARNIELLTGDQTSATDPLHTLPGDQRGRHLGALAHPRSGGIRDTLEREIARAGAARGDPSAAAAGVERTLHQRDPASALPKGATEFLAGGKTRMHFFEGADISTIMHELLHVSVHDLKGRHLDTLAHEFAGGKPLAQWTDAEHEAVANSFEQWLRTGNIDNPGLRGAFDAIKQWMLKIVGKAKDAGMVVPKDVEDAFNYMFREPLGTTLEQQAVRAARLAPAEYSKQAIARSMEMSQRVSKMMEVGEHATGMTAHDAQLSVLAGELPRIYVDHLTHFTEDDIGYLWDTLKDNPRLRPLQKTSVIQGIRAAAAGDVLTPSVQRDILRAWAPSGTKGAKGGTLLQRATQLLIEVVNIPRSFMSTLDASGMLRQGLVAATLHPALALRMFGPMLKYGWSEKYYAERMARYALKPDIQSALQFGLELTDINHPFHSEEAYQSALAEWLTGGKHGPVRRSARMYTGFLNDMRAGLVEHMYGMARRQTTFDNLLAHLGHERTPIEMTEKNLRAISTVANWATGRGHLGKHEQALSLLNLVFFSPRLMKSRLDIFNPFFYLRLSGPARREAVRAAVSLVVGGATILEMAHLAGLDVGTNPTSSDFGKIKVGNTRIDIWGGHQSVATAIMRTIERQTTNATTGAVTHLNIFEPAKRYLTGKFAPIMSFEEAYRQGKEVTGQPFNWSEATQSRMIPFVIQDAYSAYHDSGDAAFTALLATLSTFGLGANTFTPQGTGNDGPLTSLVDALSRGTQDQGPTNDPSLPPWAQNAAPRPAAGAGGGGGDLPPWAQGSSSSRQPVGAAAGGDLPPWAR